MIVGAALLYGFVALFAAAADPPLAWMLMLPVLLAIGFSGSTTRG